MVDYSSLENCRTERYRGFESLSLRKQGCKSTNYVIYALYYTQNLRAVKRVKRVVIRKTSITNRLSERFIGASFVDQFLCLIYLLSII